MVYLKKFVNVKLPIMNDEEKIKTLLNSQEQSNAILAVQLLQSVQQMNFKEAILYVFDHQIGQNIQWRAENGWAWSVCFGNATFFLTGMTTFKANFFFHFAIKSPYPSSKHLRYSKMPNQKYDIVVDSAFVHHVPRMRMWLGEEGYKLIQAYWEIENT